MRPAVLDASVHSTHVVFVPCPFLSCFSNSGSDGTVPPMSTAWSDDPLAKKISGAVLPSLRSSKLPPRNLRFHQMLTATQEVFSLRMPAEWARHHSPATSNLDRGSRRSNAPTVACPSAEKDIFQYSVTEHAASGTPDI